MKNALLNPYEGNVLVDGLGPLLDPRDAAGALMHIPASPPSMDGVPIYIRSHHLMNVLDLHLPSRTECQLQQSIDLMLRQTYKQRDPKVIATSRSHISEPRDRLPVPRGGMACAVEGISGVGKTQACQYVFRTYPSQVIQHASFPNVIGPHQQVVYLSVEVPPAGTATELARNLMLAWAQATGSSRFDHWLAKDKLHGEQALAEWRQVAFSHFLGVLHLDEVQNLFKLGTLQQRRARRGSTANAPELSIVEDKVLLWILSLINAGKVSLVFSGTPDGIGALTRRLSILERLSMGGYHGFEPLNLQFELKQESSSFLKILSRYQYVKYRIAMDEELIRVIFSLTAGVHRIVVALWVAAHRVAFERKTDDLLKEDFLVASETWLAPLKPAVEALNSADSGKLARYQDLMPRDTAFWAAFWKRASGQ